MDSGICEKSGSDETWTTNKPEKNEGPTCHELNFPCHSLISMHFAGNAVDAKRVTMR